MNAYHEQYEKNGENACVACSSHECVEYECHEPNRETVLMGVRETLNN